jgi:hypothetical protein
MKVAIGPQVRLTGVTPQMVIAHSVVTEVFRNLGFDCVITSAIDRKHKRASLHYVGSALDYSFRWVAQAYDKLAIRDGVKSALGEEYDVVSEADHLHVEWQPKEAIK